MPADQPLERSYSHAVVGDGVAACIAAASLAKEGCTVIQFLGQSKERADAALVLSPQTLVRLGQFGASLDPQIGGRADGSLTCWGTEEINHTDHAFFSVQPSFTVLPQALRAQLAKVSSASGVKQVSAAAIESGNCEIAWTDADGGSQSIQCERIVFGGGRSASFGPFRRASRLRQDKLVAFTMEWKRVARHSDLLIEAECDGWWYSPPTCKNKDHIVFVSDFDLIPTGSAARLKYVDEHFRRSRIMASCGVLVRNPKLFGVDAHSGRYPAPISGRHVAIGDAAFSVDPLAGLGVLLAIETGWFAANELAADRDLQEDYCDWLGEVQAEQRSIAKNLYSQALLRFPHSEFWSRRGQVWD